MPRVHVGASETRTPAYILWFGPTGLTIARALGREKVPVIAVHDDVHEPCLDSRYANRVQVLPRMDTDEEAWLDWLMREGEAIAPGKAALFPASDECWLFMARHREALSTHFHFALPDAPDLVNWPSKAWQRAAALRADIPHPRVLEVSNAEDLHRIADEVAYPCLVKPLMSFEWVKRRACKLEFAHDRSALIARGERALADGLEFFVQEYVPGDDCDIHGLFCCLDRDSQPLGMCVSRKIRQYPPRFGSGCMAMTTHDPRVTELGLRLLQSIGFRGIASVEFKRDVRSGDFKLIEINVRAPLMMGDAIDSGINLPYMSYCEMIGEAVPQPRRVRLGRRVGLLEQDYMSAKFYRSIGSLSWARWLFQWMRTRDLHFAWDDLRPFRSQLHVLSDHYRRGRFRSLPDGFPTFDEWHEGCWSVADVEDGRAVHAETANSMKNDTRSTRPPTSYA